MSIEIRGIEQLGALAQALQGVTEDELRRELSKGATRGFRPVRQAVKDSANRILPKRGGLAARTAKTKLAARRNRNGVRLVASSPDSLRDIDRGRIRHPVFGNRDIWVTQRVTGGWWSRPTKAAAPQVRRDVEAAMDAIAKKIDRAVR